MSALIRAMLSAESARVRPGDRTDLSLTVQNFSEIVDRYRIVVEGIDPSWVTLSRSELALFPKDQDQVRITLQPPAGPESRASHYEVNVRVISQENPSEESALHVDLEVLPISGLDLALSPQKGSGVGDGIFRLQVANQGNADLTLQFEASDPEEGCLYAFEPPRAALPAGQSCEARLRLRPKAALTQKEPRSYRFTVTARPAEDPKLARQVQGEWVQTPPAFELALRPPKASGASEGVFTLQVTNAGSADLMVQLEAADLEQACLFAFDPLQVAVPAGRQGPVSLRVRSKAPLVGDQAKAHSFIVTARPVEAPGIAQQVQGTWEQSPPSFEVALQPQKGSGVEEGTFTLRVQNPSGANLTVQFEASDLEHACLYTFSPAPVLVPAGQERSVQLQVRPRAPLAGAAPRSYPFTVTARPAEVPALTRQVQGEWTHRPRAKPRMAVGGPILLILLGWVISWIVCTLLYRNLTDPLTGLLFPGLEGILGGEAADVIAAFIVPLTIRGILVGALGGLLTGLALSWSERAVRGKQVFLILLGWALAWAMEGLFSWPLNKAAEQGIAPILIWGLFAGLVGLLGGSVTARALRQARPGVKVVLVALAWALGWGVGAVILQLLMSRGLPGSIVERVMGMGIDEGPAASIVHNVIASLVAAPIGGGLMLWHLSRAARKNST